MGPVLSIQFGVDEQQEDYIMRQNLNFLNKNKNYHTKPPISVKIPKKQLSNQDTISSESSNSEYEEEEELEEEEKAGLEQEIDFEEDERNKECFINYEEEEQQQENMKEQFDSLQEQCSIQKEKQLEMQSSMQKNSLQRADSWNRYGKINFDQREVGIGEYFLQENETNIISQDAKYFNNQKKKMQDWEEMLRYGKNKSPKHFLNLSESNNNKNNLNIDPNHNNIDNLEQLNTEQDLKNSQYLQEYIQRKRTHFNGKLKQGPPQKYRWAAWKTALQVTPDDILEKEKIFQQILNDEFNKQKNNNLENQNQVEIQIKKDIFRTFPLEKYFVDVNEQSKCVLGQKSLYRVLKVLSVYYRQVGYCQGMNFIAAFLLLISGGKEVESFCIFIKFFEQFHMAGMYEEGFPLYKVLNYIFLRCMKKNLKKLLTHFNQQSLDDNTWMFQWFETLFLYSMPFSIVVRIWDYIIERGITGVIDVGIGLLKHFRKKLYLLDQGGLYHFFINATKEIIPPLKQYHINNNNNNNNHDKQFNNKEQIVLDQSEVIRRAQKHRIYKKDFKRYANDFLKENPNFISDHQSIQRFYQDINQL